MKKVKAASVWWIVPKNNVVEERIVLVEKLKLSFKKMRILVFSSLFDVGIWKDIGMWSGPFSNFFQWMFLIFWVCVLLRYKIIMVTFKLIQKDQLKITNNNNYVQKVINNMKMSVRLRYYNNWIIAETLNEI